MPSYTSSADPYWRYRRLDTFSNALAGIADAVGARRAKRRQQEDELIAKAARLAAEGEVLDSPAVQSILGAARRPETAEAIQAAFHRTPAMEKKFAVQEAQRSQAELASKSDQAFNNYLGTMQYLQGTMRGATPDQMQAAARQLTPMQEEVLLADAGVLPKAQDPLSTQQAFMSMSAPQRGEYLGLGGASHLGLPDEVIPQDFKQSVRYDTKLERTPQQLKRSEEEDRRMGFKTRRLEEIDRPQVDISDRRTTLQENKYETRNDPKPEKSSVSFKDIKKDIDDRAKAGAMDPAAAKAAASDLRGKIIRVSKALEISIPEARKVVLERIAARYPYEPDE